jgi:N6-L-threonylcarbamoyladenine synthase
VGPLLVGASYAQGLAAGWGVPLRGVHHLRGHLASVLLGIDSPRGLSERAQELFPAIVLLVSGGHTQVLRVDAGLRAEAWADTADDAAGECFDKSAKLMGLPYPGGPSIEKLAGTLAPADEATAKRIFESLPRPRSAEGYSFSGLKTAIRLKLQADPSLAPAPAFAWAVQEAIGATLLSGLKRSFEGRDTGGLKSLVFCGGVAANARLRGLVSDFAAKRKLRLALPPLKHCTDNAAMIAAAAWVQSPALALEGVVARTPL